MDLVLALVLVLVNAFFVAAEFGIARLGPTQVDDFVRQGRPGARSARHAVDHIDDEVLREMRRDRRHLALVLDEHGTVVGLVTLEDVIEEVVGEIEDEFDPRAHELVRRDGDGVWIDGAAPVLSSSTLSKL